MRPAADELAPVTAIDTFDTIIDARTPAEFAEDHLPGAINCPVLTNEERAIVGTIYKQDSPFAARRIGGAWVARHIADHIERHFQDRPRDWRPLVYCWRGGQRSGAFVTWLRLIGWEAAQLEGGYKAFRRHLLAELAHLPARFTFWVVGGPTGCGKTHLLSSLAQQGGQVLDLEGLARHRGSLLGAWPDGSVQPGQKAFETALWDALRRFDPAKPVFVEAENRRIGRCHLPEALWQAITRAPLLVVDAPFSQRHAFLLREYAFWQKEPERLAGQLARLKGLQPNERLERWLRWARAGELASLYAELMVHHYDPLYRKGLERHPRTPLGTWYLPDLSDTTLAATAREWLALAQAATGSEPTLTREK